MISEDPSAATIRLTASLAIAKNLLQVHVAELTAA